LLKNKDFFWFYVYINHFMGFRAERIYQKYLKLNLSVNLINFGIYLNFTKNCTKTPKYYNLAKIWILDSLQECQSQCIILTV